MYEKLEELTEKNASRLCTIIVKDFAAAALMDSDVVMNILRSEAHEVIDQILNAIQAIGKDLKKRQ